MAFSTRIPVNFGDTDPAGLVYFPNLLHYCHIVMEHFFEEICGVHYSRLIEEQRLGFPTVKIDAEFKTPLRYGDVVEVELSVLEVGNKSVTFSYLIKKGDGQNAAEVKQIVVAMDLGAQQSVVIPEAIRDRLKRA
ncbi:MAG TPA: thioesterase family protein [Pyrinomonadaceae bacterium]|jgi:4-hydroxybenzoyl-CoA thioesterase